LTSPGKPAADYDVAVVGGGVSGVYSAWRLRADAPRSKVLGPLAARAGGLRVGLFEYGDRIGGRLFSVRLAGNPGPPIELGGMRFLTSHVRVAKLVRKLGLPTRELLVNDPAKRHLFYLRGRRFGAAEWDRPGFVPPYLLDRGERSRSPGKLLIEVALRHLGGRLDELQAIGYRSPALDGLRDVGFRNLMLREMSAEAYQLVRDACGYDTLVNNWGAAEAIPFLLADFDPKLQYLALDDGYQALPLRLADEFKNDGGGPNPVLLGHRLFRLDPVEGGIRLTFDRSGKPPANPRRVSPADEFTCVARHVILAMPRRSIELLHPDSFLFDCPTFAEDLASVLPQAGFKIFAAYRAPWWLDQHGITAGRSVTDLPIRQCYYWGTGPKLNDKDPYAARNSVLMASYNDGGSVEFWAGLTRDKERYRPPDAACPPGVPVPDPTAPEDASAALVAELQNQLRELHGLSTLESPDASDIVPPYAVKFRDWTADPFGGGWHFWKIGARSKEIAARMRQPAAPHPVYVCGEAWSHQQGWVEGALETADDLLENVLGLPPL
jgi:monoamine oxidase